MRNSRAKYCALLAGSVIFAEAVFAQPQCQDVSFSHVYNWQNVASEYSTDFVGDYLDEPFFHSGACGRVFVNLTFSGARRAQVTDEPFMALSIISTDGPFYVGRMPGAWFFFEGENLVGGTDASTGNLPDRYEAQVSKSSYRYNDDIVSFAGLRLYFLVPNNAVARTYDRIALTIPGTVSFAVPEPSSWAMLIVGFGLTGSALRRRRPRQTHSLQ